MPTSLQGLNLVYPAQPPSDAAGQDTLTPPPGFPDLSAQLDLWTNLSFASDEPFIAKDRKEHDLLAGFNKVRGVDGAEGPPEINRLPHLISDAEKPAQTAIDNNLSIPPNNDQVSFDLGTFLAGFGIDPFLVPPQSSHPALLSPMTPSTSAANSSPSDLSKPSIASPEIDGQPPNKRTRTRQDSTASQGQAVAPAALQQRALSADLSGIADYSDDHDPLSTPLTAAEDKRRRNTAASARFRAKKKEREQALEKRSKELETKVAELERECEGLRRENGWLKGLVVGVTGSNPSGVPAVPADGGGASDSSDRGKRKRGPESNNGSLEA